MNPGGGGQSDLERLLERELARSVRSLRAPSTSPAQAAYHRVAERARSRALLAALGAASGRLGAGLVAAGLVATCAIVAATGSPNPTVWGRTVTRAVATCRGSLPSGRRGIGPCVSAVAQQQSAQEPTEQAVPSPAPTAHEPAAAPVVPTPATATTAPSSDRHRQEACQVPGHAPASEPAVAHAQATPAARPTAGSGHAADRPGGQASSPPGGRPASSWGNQPGTSYGAGGTNHAGGSEQDQGPIPFRAR